MSPIALPVTEGEIRFAVGSPDGMTSNSWKMWANPKGDVYLACRDNFRDAKVSLHTSGKWRMGFTEDAVEQHPELVAGNQNRAWQVWDEPPALLPNAVCAFQLIFPASELAVRPEQRTTKLWKKECVLIEAPPPGELTVITLFITTGDLRLQHASEPSVCLASLDIGQNRRAQLIAHGASEEGFPELISLLVWQGWKNAEAKGVALAEDAYGYFLGTRTDGTRFIVGARMQRATGQTASEGVKL